jgi:hypothetical protein
MTLKIQASVIEGYRVASGTSTIDQTFNIDGGTIRLQMPEFKKRGLDFDDYLGNDNYLCGTLGLSVAPYIVKILNPEYYFKDVRWTDKFDKPDQLPYVENFFLDKASVIFNGQSYLGLIYIPDPLTKPGHFHLPTTIEVIAQKIPYISYGSIVTLEYNEKAIICEYF